MTYSRFSSQYIHITTSCDTLCTTAVAIAFGVSEAIPAVTEVVVQPDLGVVADVACEAGVAV